MEVYILDNLLRRTMVIDRFESFIWTERCKLIGDFELVIQSTRANRNIFTEGTRLAHNDSKRVMVIETTESKQDSEGRSVLSVTGRSLELVLDERIAASAISDLTTTPNWELSGTPGAIARQIFKEICVDGKLDPGDKIPFITPGTIFPPDTLVEPNVVLDMAIEPKTVYAAISEICEIHGLNFRLVRNFDNSQLHFDVYSGVDRTNTQDDVKPVIFSPDLDNLEDITELSTSADYKNVAYVFSKHGARIVYALGIEPNVVGFERRAIVVTATDIEMQDGPELQGLLEQRGRDELSKHRRVTGFDGEVSQFGDYKYGVDYELGDLVEMRSSEGVTTNMRVTEQIFVSDSEGERSYPTLTIDTFVMSGTWIAWDYDQVWPEAIGTWGDLGNAI